MRIRKGSAVVLVLAMVASVAVAGIAVGGGGNSSSLQGSKFFPNTLPKDNFKSGRLHVHTHTDYGQPGNFTDRSQLYFDDDGRLKLAGIPKCDKSKITGSDNDMADAMAACGPSKIGTGTARALVGGGTEVPACVLVFNGQSQNGKPTTLVYTRADTVPPLTITCGNPGSNHQGNATVVLEGLVKPNPSSLGADFTSPDHCSAPGARLGCQLDVDNIGAASPFPLTDFKVDTQRGDLLSARCHDADHKLNFKGKFTYNNGPSDTVGTSQTCTVG
jgi:hypothetical protein